MKVNTVKVQEALEGMNYPAKRDYLVQHAKDNGADKDVLEELKSLPDQFYNTEKDVTRKLM